MNMQKYDPRDYTLYELKEAECKDRIRDVLMSSSHTRHQNMSLYMTLPVFSRRDKSLLLCCSGRYQYGLFYTGKHRTFIDDFKNESDLVDSVLAKQSLWERKASEKSRQWTVYNPANRREIYRLGQPGRKPNWLKAWLKSGQSLDDLPTL